MKYNVGDRVRIKSWDELVNEFDNFEGFVGVMLPGRYISKIDYDNWFSKNRIITIIRITKFNNFEFLDKEASLNYITKEMVKGYANEYYLQEIKDEL